MGAFIAKMLLPTVSSLVFLPTASVAAKRGFHMEAMVYFFTMFFIAVSFWSSVPQDFWFSSCPVFWSFGFLVFWCSGLLVFCSGFLVFWSSSLQVF